MLWMMPALAFLKGLAWIGRPQSKSQTRQLLVHIGDQIAPSKLKWTNRKASPKFNQMAKLNGKPRDKLEEVHHDANFIMLSLRARHSPEMTITLNSQRSQMNHRKRMALLKLKELSKRRRWKPDRKRKC